MVSTVKTRLPNTATQAEIDALPEVGREAIPAGTEIFNTTTGQWNVSLLGGATPGATTWTVNSFPSGNPNEILFSDANSNVTSDSSLAFDNILDKFSVNATSIDLDATIFELDGTSIALGGTTVAIDATTLDIDAATIDIDGNAFELDVTSINANSTSMDFNATGSLGIGAEDITTAVNNNLIIGVDNDMIIDVDNNLSIGVNNQLTFIADIVMTKAGDFSYTFEDSSQGLDEKKWAFNSDSGVFQFVTLFDNGNMGDVIFDVTRTNESVDLVTFEQTTNFEGSVSITDGANQVLFNDPTINSNIISNSNFTYDSATGNFSVSGNNNSFAFISNGSASAVGASQFTINYGDGIVLDAFVLDFNASNLRYKHFSNVLADGLDEQITRGRGTDVAPVAVLDQDAIHEIAWKGIAPTSLTAITGAGLKVEVDGTPTATSVPMSLTLTAGDIDASTASVFNLLPTGEARLISGSASSQQFVFDANGNADIEGPGTFTVDYNTAISLTSLIVSMGTPGNSFIVNDNGTAFADGSSVFTINYDDEIDLTTSVVDVNANTITMSGTSINFDGQVVSASYAPCTTGVLRVISDQPNPGVTVGAIITGSLTTDFRVLMTDATISPIEPIIGIALTAATNPGDEFNMCTAEIVEVQMDSVSSCVVGEAIEKSVNGTDHGRVTQDTISANTFAQAAEAAGPNDLFKVWRIKER